MVRADGAQHGPRLLRRNHHRVLERACQALRTAGVGAMLGTPLYVAGAGGASPGAASAHAPRSHASTGTSWPGMERWSAPGEVVAAATKEEEREHDDDDPGCG